MGLFIFVTILFIVVSILMVLIILVQRPQGGGLAGAFGGASGGGTDTVFGGRVGDALTAMTVIAFALYILLAIALNIIDNKSDAVATTQPTVTQVPPPTGDTPPMQQTITIPADTAGTNSGVQITPITVTPGTSGTPGSTNTTNTPAQTPPQTPAQPSGMTITPPVTPPPATSPGGGGTP